jgi:ribosomal protein S27AE
MEKTIMKPKYKGIKIKKEDYEVLKEIKRLYGDYPTASLITIAWPRCPKCMGPLVQKFFSHRLVCARCGAEFKVDEVVTENSVTE